MDRLEGERVRENNSTSLKVGGWGGGGEQEEKKKDRTVRHLDS